MFLFETFKCYKTIRKLVDLMNKIFKFGIMN